MENRFTPRMASLKFLLIILFFDARSLGASGRTESFEEMETRASKGTVTTLEQAWEYAEALLPICSAQNEFVARECAAKASLSRRMLSRGMIALSVDSEQVSLGRYDFEKKQFPAYIQRQFGSKRVAINSTAANQSREAEDEDECPDVEEYETDHADELTLLADGKVAWQGSLHIVDLSIARKLREGASSIVGDVILALEGVSVQLVQDPTPLQRKQHAMRKIAAYLHGPYPAMVKHQARKKLRCWTRLKTAWRQVVVKVRLVGLRLHVDDERMPGYLVSFPPSAPRAQKNLAQATVETGETKKELNDSSSKPSPPAGYEDVF